jgi:hypothetical protein
VVEDVEEVVTDVVDGDRSEDGAGVFPGGMTVLAPSRVDVATTAELEELLLELPTAVCIKLKKLSQSVPRF